MAHHILPYYPTSDVTIVSTVALVVTHVVKPNHYENMPIQIYSKK